MYVYQCNVRGGKVGQVGMDWAKVGGGGLGG